MKKLSRWTILVCLLASDGFSQSVPCAGSFTCVSIDVTCDPTAPPSACPAGIAPGSTAQTVASGINPAGDVVGYYFDSVGREHGFLFSGGRFTTIDVPGAVFTGANGIGPSGDVVGNYGVPYVPGVTDAASADPSAYCPAANSPACVKGFLYQHGRFSSVLFSGHPGAIPQRIAPDGTIYGCLHDFDFMLSMFGAVWTRFGARSLTENGGEVTDGMARPMSMNNGATPDGRMVVGLWNDMMTNRRHGFTVRNGEFQSYDVPGAALTAIWDVNPGQQFVGTYVAGGIRHGFLQNPDGSPPINIDFPGAAGSVAFGINAGGVIVGQYMTSGRSHGFAAIPQTTN